jgi:hypothetical protein
VKSD